MADAIALGPVGLAATYAPFQDAIKSLASEDGAARHGPAARPLWVSLLEALDGVNETDQGTALGRCASLFGTDKIWVCSDEVADTCTPCPLSPPSEICGLWRGNEDWPALFGTTIEGSNPAATLSLTLTTVSDLRRLHTQTF